MEIKDYPNYLIYDDGRIYSKFGKGRFLKPCNNGRGYMQVSLCKDGKRKQMFVHRLIALHYIDNPENKGEVDHIDRDKTNNDISNLRWCSHSENGLNKDVYGAIKIRGVSKIGNRFRSSIKIDGKPKHLGYYDTPEEAGEVFNNFCLSIDRPLY